MGMDLATINRWRAVRGQPLLPALGQQAPLIVVGPDSHRAPDAAPVAAPSSQGGPAFSTVLTAGQYAAMAPRPDFLGGPSPMIFGQSLPENYTVLPAGANRTGKSAALDQQAGNLAQIANLHGITSKNIFEKLTGTINDYRNGMTGGGNDYILGSFVNPDAKGNEGYSLRESGFFRPAQHELLLQFVATGTPPPGLDPNYAALAYTQGLDMSGQRVQEAVGRKSLVDSLMKNLITGVVKAGFTAGAAGGLGPIFTGGLDPSTVATVRNILDYAPEAGAATGATVAGVKSGGDIGSILSGGLEGYSIGSTIGGVGTASLSGYDTPYVPGGGYSDPSAVGGNANELYNPDILGGPVAGVTNNTLAGGGFINPDALGLDGRSLGLNFESDRIGFFRGTESPDWEGTVSNADGGFSNPSAVGGDVSSIDPQFASLNRAPSSGSNFGGIANSVGNFLGTLSGQDNRTLSGQDNRTLSGPANNSLAGTNVLSSNLPNNTSDAGTVNYLANINTDPLTAGTNPVTDQFNYALQDALTGKGKSKGSNAANQLGAGLIAPTQRDMQRNPGYQPRPFANYLMRG